MTGNIKLCLPVVIPIVAFIIWKTQSYNEPQPSNKRCWRDLAGDGSTECRPECGHGFFSLPTMMSCLPWLQCEDMNDIKIVELIGQGAVKLVYLAKWKDHTWKDHTVVLNKLVTQAYHEDFQHGLQMMSSYQPHPHFITLIGFCFHRHSSAIITEYQPFGAAININTILTSSLKFRTHNTLSTRFQLCVDYVTILNHLHNGTTETRIMCDTNTLDKTLHQYLLTRDLRLVVNDLDALPSVDRSKNLTAVCGRREIFGDFVAPEQLWPFDDCEYDHDLMPGYDEKSDIWKVPDVCEFFLSDYPRAESVKFHLFKIHKRCKGDDPTSRPTASEIYEEYQKVWQKFDIESDKKQLDTA